MKLQQYSWSRLVRYAKGELPVKDIIRRSGEVAVDLISAITHRKDKAFAVLNVPNRCAFTNLPEEAVLEMPAVADESGTKRIELRDMPIPIDAITQFRIAQQELTVEAALTGDRNIALQALLLDPLTPSIEVAENILDELLEAHSSHLPQFH